MAAGVRPRRPSPFYVARASSVTCSASGRIIRLAGMAGENPFLHFFPRTARVRILEIVSVAPFQLFPHPVRSGNLIGVMLCDVVPEFLSELEFLLEGELEDFREAVAHRSLPSSVKMTSWLSSLKGRAASRPARKRERP